MPKVDGLVIKLPENRRELFIAYASEGKFFSEPVAPFAHSNSIPLLCFVLMSDGLTHIAEGNLGQWAGSELRRVNLTRVLPLQKTIPEAQIVSGASGRVSKYISDRLNRGGLLTERGLQHVIETLLRLAPEAEELLYRFTEGYKTRLQRLSPEARFNLAAQKEALLTALLAAGQDFDRKSVQYWTPPEKPKSFLDGLDRVRLTENQMILADLHKFPGLSAMDGKIKGSAIFFSPSETLTVIHADKGPLETLTGADLIYYNEIYNSFVFVQYKALESDKGYRPDAQLAAEIQRMDSLLDHAGHLATTECSGFRLHGNPFFLKLCPRIDFAPESTELTKGMYIPLEYWKILESSGQIAGPRGGKIVTYENVGRHLSNSEFATLVLKAWVGSTPSQSSVLEPLIRDTIASGKAVIYAVKKPNKKGELYQSYLQLRK